MIWTAVRILSLCLWWGAAVIHAWNQNLTWTLIQVSMATIWTVVLMPEISDRD